MVLTAIIHKEDDWFVAECPEVGTASQGKSVEEALANLKEATEVYLDEFPRQSTVHPILTTFEVATHAEVIGLQAPRTPRTIRATP
jgi:predicted RNase H-like HicB family nuclease